MFRAGLTCTSVAVACLLWATVTAAYEHSFQRWSGKKFWNQPDYTRLELASFEAASFKPVGNLNALTDTFTLLGHPAFPKYSVRIKQSDFCDGTVAAYTGYIDVEARHLFFYFFESRSDPDRDDVIFWTNGGPGGSSSMGLFMELGPCRVVNSTSVVYNKASWNANANIFFIDQPVDVGFSYAEHGEYVSTTEEAAKDIAAFVSIFFEHFSSFKGRALHMAGESYGGRYIPLFSSAIYDQNIELVKAGLTPINLTSAIIGTNGVTNRFTQITSYYDMQCTPASVEPITDISTCTRMKQAIPRCQKLMETSCIAGFDPIGCDEAIEVCRMEIQDPYWKSGMNVYDISKKCEGSLEETHCYPITKLIQQYLSQPHIRQKLGVDPSIPLDKPLSSHNVGLAFAGTLDGLHPSDLYVAALLERGVDVLIYAGTYDWICNWVGNERWTLALDWSGKEEFVSQSLREWKVNGEVAGMTRSAKGFTFATIDGAGHMVPYDKPWESLEMVNRWLKNRQL
ncbi:serine carboxypeptidase [Neolentinus lepideus HHB14362 ss-1]|uniref:Carboxypeptidase n=1 Tax=Neolentinus lepideus HHB14362 ss-1 TaxID=1314782 RepID=A0A165RWC1_9AGAM|nr:serine carboxypeptidase [Neolentinus lepideus HHB14362 ss-1]